MPSDRMRNELQPLGVFGYLLKVVQSPRFTADMPTLPPALQVVFRYLEVLIADIDLARFQTSVFANLKANPPM